MFKNIFINCPSLNDIYCLHTILEFLNWIRDRNTSFVLFYMRTFLKIPTKINKYVYIYFQSHFIINVFYMNKN